MHFPSLVFASTFTTVVKSILSLGDGLFKFKETAVKESVARGYGFNTLAALLAKLHATPDGINVTFSRTAFFLRMLELDPKSAEALDVLMDGVQIDVSIEKYGNPRQAEFGSSAIIYHAVVTVAGLAPDIDQSNRVFLLPVFGTSVADEHYSVDSAPRYKVETDQPVTRFGKGGQLLTVRLIEGRWGGEFFIYSAAHQLDDTQCVKSCRAALARAVLSAMTPRVRCEIWRPDGYAMGGWCVRMTLGPEVTGFWGDGRLAFELPALRSRLIHTKPPYLFNGPKGGCFIDGEWNTHLYSNGVAEAENPTTLPQVKAALYRSVYDTLEKGGYSEWVETKLS